jgi:arylsulfatase A-like enzyme
MSAHCTRAFIIGLDGAIGWAVAAAATPRLDGIFQRGVVTFMAKTTVPPASFEAWGAMFHGVGPDKHRIDDDHAAAEAGPWPSFIKVANEQRPRMKCASFVGWEPINTLILESSCRCHRVAMPDEELAQAAARYIRAEKPDLFTMQLDSIDHAGHHEVYGSRKYIEQIGIVDGYVGTVVDAIVESGMLEESLIVVCSDHGGVGTHHDGTHLDCTRTFWACRWPGAPERTYFGAERVNIADTAPVVARALGLTAPAGWDGRVPEGVLADP